jgi:hypothetical protein
LLHVGPIPDGTYWDDMVETASLEVHRAGVDVKGYVKVNVRSD